MAKDLPTAVPRGIDVIDAYRNLTSGTWSAKAVEGVAVTAANKNKVVAYPHDITLTSCTFKVLKGGRDDTRRTCQKWVHAFVRGTLGALPKTWPKNLIVEATYNPYLFDTFTLLVNARPLLRAAWVEFPTAAGPGPVKPLRVGLYIEDEGLPKMSALKPPAARVARMLWCRQPAEKRREDQARGREVPIANPTRMTLRQALLSAGWNG